MLAESEPREPCIHDNYLNSHTAVSPVDSAHMNVRRNIDQGNILNNDGKYKNNSTLLKTMNKDIDKLK